MYITCKLTSSLCLSLSRSKSLILGTYVRLFGCDLAEAEKEDIQQYKNLGELFRRRLKEGKRQDQ